MVATGLNSEENTSLDHVVKKSVPGNCAAEPAGVVVEPDCRTGRRPLGSWREKNAGTARARRADAVCSARGRPWRLDRVRPAPGAGWLDSWVSLSKEFVMNKYDANSFAHAAMVTLADIKAAHDAFDRGEANVFDSLDAIRVAIESYEAAVRKAAEHRPGRRRDAA